MKGGVGKTAIVANLAGFFANDGYRVLVVGVDAQEDITDAYLSGNPEYDVDAHYSLTDIIRGAIEPEEAVVSTPAYRKYTFTELFHVKRRPGKGTYTFDMIPAGPDPSSIPDGDPFYFNDKFGALFNQYDYVFFDTPPADHDSTALVYMASDYAIVPVTDTASFKSVQMISERIQWARGEGSNISLMGIVINRFSGQRKISTFKEEMFRRSEVSVFEGVIRESSGVENAFFMGVPLVSYDWSLVTEDFYHLYSQILGKA